MVKHFFKFRVKMLNDYFVKLRRESFCLSVFYFRHYRTSQKLMKGVQESHRQRVGVIMKMVMFLQNEPDFDKFFKYGCWCFPEGDQNVIGGYGEPQDNVDTVRLSIFSVGKLFYLENCLSSLILLITRYDFFKIFSCEIFS